MNLPSPGLRAYRHLDQSVVLITIMALLFMGLIFHE